MELAPDYSYIYKRSKGSRGARVDDAAENCWMSRQEESIFSFLSYFTRDDFKLSELIAVRMEKEGNESIFLGKVTSYD